MWHVRSRSVVATLRTAVHLLLTYLLMLQVVKNSVAACDGRLKVGQRILEVAFMPCVAV